MLSCDAHAFTGSGAEQIRPAVPDPRKGKNRVLRLGNGVLMSGIDTSTLISVERCPRYIYILI